MSVLALAVAGACSGAGTVASASVGSSSGEVAAGGGGAGGSGGVGGAGGAGGAGGSESSASSTSSSSASSASSASSSSGANVCPDGTPCGAESDPLHGTCIGGVCCASCIKDGVCIVPGLTQLTCGAHGVACDPDGTPCGGAWVCAGGQCGPCGAAGARCSFGLKPGLCVAEAGGGVACKACNNPVVSDGLCPPGCVKDGGPFACEGPAGSGNCGAGCCPGCY